MTEIEIQEPIYSVLYVNDEKRGRTIDLMPVKRFMSKLEGAIESEQNLRDHQLSELTPYFLEEASNMDADQLRYLVTDLMGKIKNQANLFQCVLDNPEQFIKNIKEYRQIERLMKSQDE